MQSPYLRYGDLIILYSEDAEGFLSTQGYVTFGILFYFGHNSINGSQLFACPEQDRERIRNFNDFVFQVYPKLSYDALNDLEEYQQSTNRTSIVGKRTAGGQSPILRGGTIAATKLQHDPDRHKMLKRKAQEEEQLNSVTVGSKANQSVAYGDDVQLLHCDSNMFIRSRTIVAQLDKSCNRLEMTGTQMNGIVFKILPRYKYRQEGEKIQHSDQIVFFNLKHKLYLHVSQKFELPINQMYRLVHQCKLATDVIETERRSKPQEFQKLFQVNLSTNSSSRIQVLPYSKYKENAMKFIKSGMLIRLQHTELGGYLASDGTDYTGDGLAEVFVRTTKQKEEHEDEDIYNSTNSIFVVEIADIDELEPQSIELHDIMNRGRICRWKSDSIDEERMAQKVTTTFRLRHFNTGRLVRAQVVTKPTAEEFDTLGLADHLDGDQPLPASKDDQWDNTGFKFEPTNVENFEQIRDGSCIKLSTKGGLFVSVSNVNWDLDASQLVSVNVSVAKHSKTNSVQTNKSGYLRHDRLGLSSLNRSTRSISGINDHFLQIEDDYLGVQRRQVKLSTSNFNQDAYILMSCEQTEVHDLLFAHAHVAQLHMISKVFEKGVVGEADLQRSIDLLTSLIFYITTSEDDNPYTCEGIPSKRRQKILRELDICSLLTLMLSSPFKTDQFVLTDIRKNQSITLCCTLCYRLIKHLVKGNRLNQLYASNWIDLYFDQAMQTADDNDIKAESTITELISNNKKLLEEQISEETIIKFINLCKAQKRHRRFIDLLTALCSSLGHAIPSNQALICQNIYEDSATNQAMVMRMDYIADQVAQRQVRVWVSQDYHQGWIDLIDLPRVCKRHRDIRLYEYFISMINLGAQLCFQRNSPVMGVLTEIYPYDITLSVISSEQYLNKFRAAFINLTMSLHIDKDPLQKLIAPKLPRVLHEISNSLRHIQLPTTQLPLPASLLQLKDFALGYLTSLAGQIVAHDEDANNLLFEVLRMVKFMIEYGFYTRSEEVKNLAQPLIALLDGSSDDYTEVEKEVVEYYDREASQVGIRRNLTSPIGMANMIGKGVNSFVGNSMSPSHLEDQAEIEHSERYQQNEHNLIVMNCKCKICEILLKLLDIESDMQISAFLCMLKQSERSSRKGGGISPSSGRDFKKGGRLSPIGSELGDDSIFEDVSKNGKPKLQIDLKHPATSISPIGQLETGDTKKTRNTNFLMSTTHGVTTSQSRKEVDSSINETPRKTPRKKKVSNNKSIQFLYEFIEEKEEEELMEKEKRIVAIEWIQKALEISSFQWKSNEKLICILLDMLLYEDSDLVHKAFELLFRLFSRNNRLSQLLRKVQLMENPEAIQVISKVDQKMNDLAKLCDKRHQWLGENSQPANTVTQNASNIVIFLMNLLIDQPPDHILRKDSEGLKRLTTEPQKEKGSRRGGKESETPVDEREEISMLLAQPDINERDISSLLNLASGVISNRDVLNDQGKMPQQDILKGDSIGVMELVEGYKNLGGDSNQIFQKSEAPNQENQRLFRNLNAHSLVIQLLEFKTYTQAGRPTTEILQAVKGVSQPVIGVVRQNQEAWGVGPDAAMSQACFDNFIHICYLFLIRFCRFNSANQNILHKNLGVFLNDIERTPLAIYLIQQIFRNNDHLVRNDFTKTVTTLCNFIDILPLESPRKAEFLRVLRVFISCKQKLIASHQDQITLTLATSQDGRLLEVLTNPEILPSVIHKSKSEELTSRKQQSPKMTVLDLEVAPQLNYAIELLNLLALCCEGNHEVSRQKCKELIPLKDLVHLVDQAQYLWPLKQALLLFLNNVYLVEIILHSPNNVPYGLDQSMMRSDRGGSGLRVKDQPLLSSINTLNPSTGGLRRSTHRSMHHPELYGVHLQKLLELFINDINYWVLQGLQSSNTYRRIQFPNGKRVSLKSYALAYCYSSILPSLMTMLQNNQYILWAAQNLERLVRTLVDMYYGTDVSSFKTFVYHVLRYIYDTPQLSNYLDSIKHPINSDDTFFKMLDQEDPSKVIANQAEEEADANSLTHVMTNLLAEMLSSEQFKEMKEFQFEELVSYVKNVEERTTKNLKEPVDFRNLISSMLKMFEGQTQLPTELQVNCLKILRKLIEIENPEKRMPAAYWDTNDWKSYEQQIIFAQQKLSRLGVCEEVCKVYSDTDSRDIQDECLLTFIALTLGGNENVQQRFYDYMMNDDSNKLMVKSRDLFQMTFEEVRKYIQGLMVKSKSNLAKKQSEMSLGGLNKLKSFIRQSTLVDQKLQKSEMSRRRTVGASMILEDQFSLNETVGVSRTHNQSQSNVLDSLIEDKVLDSSGDIAFSKGQLAMVTCMNILRFFQLLCENHNSKLQNFLRVQMQGKSINGKSFDFVTYTTTIYGIYQRSCLHAQSCLLGYQIVETLTQFVQGPCPENQKSLVSGKVIDVSRDLLSQFEKSKDLLKAGFTSDKIAKINELKSKAVTLMLSLLEGDVDIEYVKKMTQALDNFHILFDRMKFIYEEFISKKLKMNPETASLKAINSALKKEHFDSFITDGFDLYILIYTLADFSEQAMARLKEGENEFHNTFAFFRHHTGRIEVLNGDRLQRVYFPIKPTCKHLSAPTKEQQLLNVDRESAQTKIIGFLEAVPDLIDEMTHVEKLSRADLKITPNSLNFFQNIAILLALAINVIMLIFYERSSLGTSGHLYAGATIPDSVDITLMVLGITQAVIAVIILIGWYVTRAVLLMKQKWRERIKANRADYISDGKFAQLQQIESRHTIPATQLSLQEARKVLALKGPEAQEFTMTGKRNFGHGFVKFEYYWTSMKMLLGAPKLQYMVAYITLAILGLQVSPFFYTLHLLDVVTRFPTLRNVIQAVTKNSRQLLLTALLGLIIIYIFSVIAFSFLYDMYYDEDINLFETTDKGDSICYTLVHCLLSNLNYGLRMGGGIGEFLSPISINQTSEYYTRILFDMLFFVIITFTLLNIIFGIIIDTFAELRDAKKKIDQDVRNKCFICSLDRYTFERNADGFEQHQKVDHDVWSYLYFIIHLKTKDQTDFNGTQSYIYEKVKQELTGQLQKDDITWIPLHRAIVLDKKKPLESEQNEIFDQFDGLSKLAGNLENQVGQLSSQNKKKKSL